MSTVNLPTYKKDVLDVKKKINLQYYTINFHARALLEMECITGMIYVDVKVLSHV